MNEMTEVFELLKVYKEAGLAAFFMACELLTIYFFYKELKSSKSETAAMVEKVTMVADKASAAILMVNDAMTETKTGMDQIRSQNSEFLAYLKGRDENRRVSR
jgi:hypothetical protein